MKDETLLFRIRFGLRIKQLRVQNKIEQSALASDLDKDKQFINRYENEGANPRADIVQDLAKALKVKTIDELFDFKYINELEVKSIFDKIRKKQID